MKVVFLSIYYNHHQAPFSEEMYRLTEGNYTFVESGVMSQERQALGYGIEKPEFVVTYTENNKDNLQQKINEADIVIIGSAPQNLIEYRLDNSKLTFEYSERINKTGLSFEKWLRQMAGRILRYRRYKGTYMLCASAYTAADFAKICAYKNKCYKWGYFPKAIQYESVERLIESKRPASIMWAGRLIEWKHPELPIMVAKKLKENGYEFTLDVIGNGEMEEKLKNVISENGLADCVHLLGAMKPEEVRRHMEQSEIFMFTSDFNEGWGAVLNESMNSACAVVASHAIGSVPFLLNDNENGFIYHSGDVDELYQKVVFLLDHPDERKRLGKAAYHTITEEWNAKVAAERLVAFSQEILNGNDYPNLYIDGPCSRSEIIKNDWLKA